MQESEWIRKISKLGDEMLRVLGETWYAIEEPVMKMAQWKRDREKALIRSRRNQLGQRKRYKHGRTYRTR